MLASTATAARLKLPRIDRRPRSSLDQLPRIAAFVSFAVGGTALLGWWFGVDTLKSIVPGLLTMKVNTAIAFVLLGVGLWMRSGDPDTRAHRLGVTPLVVVVALSAAVGTQYVSGQDLGIDQWLFYEPPNQTGTIQPNRMSPMTVMCFIVVGLGVLFARRPQARVVVPALLLIAVILASLNVLDFLFGADAPTILVGSTQMALNTAVTMTIVGIGAMGLMPQGGPLDVFRGSASSARLARRLLVAAVVTPVGLAWLRSLGEGLGLYGSRYGTTLIVLGTILLLAVVIWQGARSARRTELDRLAAFEERDRFFDVSGDLLATASADGFFVRLNPAWTSALGFELAELYTRPLIDFVHPDDIEATNREVGRQVNEGRSVFNFQNRYRHRDGTYRWLEWTSSPSADGAWLYAVARDVTDRKLEEERLQAPAMALARRRAETVERIQSTIDAEAFAPVFQPVISLASGEAIGFEALTRFADGSRPDVTFAMAVECGLGPALERVTLAAALRDARRLPRPAWLSVNVSPTLLADVGSMQVLLGVRARSLVLEVTEHETIAAYGPLREAVIALGPDIRLAVDDAGAGVANFNHLIELRPDFVKVDMGLVRGVDHDVSRQAVIAGILHFAAAAGCQVIAEGIETESELAVLIELGVSLGQGYLLGRPASADAWRSGPASGLRMEPTERRDDRRLVG